MEAFFLLLTLGAFCAGDPVMRAEQLEFLPGDSDFQPEDPAQEICNEPHEPESGPEDLVQAAWESESEFDPEVKMEKAWNSFKGQYGKKYSTSEEEERRKQIFYDSLKTIESHNQLFKTGRSTFSMGINQFSDMEFSEFIEMHGLKEFNASDFKKNTNQESSVPVTDKAKYPCYVDWRSKGYVTRVKNQGSCGSSWAFSATGSLEGQYKKSTGRLVSLSEQNLVDCSVHQGNRGCSGGWMSYAFNYIIQNHGIDTEYSYPYTGRFGYCRYRSAYRGATVRGYVSLTHGSEAALTSAVAYIGPISVSIDVRPSFQHYRSGIYEDPLCDRNAARLAVLVVGYGSTYYTVKNSWGTGWGSGGYVFIARNKGNMCGIATYGIYPVV